MRSAHGKSWHIFKLAYSGPNDDWLDGNAVGPKGESDEIDFGHKEGDFLAFTITLNEPDGQRVKSFFIGRMMGDKIVGTFVHAAGIKGEWTAVRELSIDCVFGASLVPEDKRLRRLSPGELRYR